MDDRCVWPLTALLLAITAIFLGQAIQVNNGRFAPAGLVWLGAAIIACVMAISGLYGAKGSRGLLILVLGAGLALQLYGLFTRPPALYLQDPDYQSYALLVAVAFILAGSALLPWPRLSRLCFPLLLVVYFLLGAWVISYSPRPHIDVYEVHQEACRALLKGENPYAISMPDIYGPSASRPSRMYPPGTSVNGWLIFGYTYPPASLLLSVPGYLLGGDYRYSMLAAVTAAAAFIAYARPGRLGKIAASLLLLTPRGLLVIEQGWTEPALLLPLSACVFCALRAPRLVPVLLGLFFAGKQYAFLAAPAAFFVLPRPLAWGRVGRFTLIVLATAAAVTLPLVLVNPHAFVNSIIPKAVFRPDALNFAAYYYARTSGSRLGGWICWAMALAAAGLALWRLPRTPGALAAATGAIFLLFFAFAIQAFCNYYFLIIGAFCCAVATIPTPIDTSPGHAPPSRRGASHPVAPGP